MKNTAILLYEIVVAYTLGCQQSPSFVPINSDIQLSNRLPTPIQAIVPSLRFECQSLITGGNIRAVGTSTFDLQVWRPRDDTGNFYDLVWRREFRRRSIGLSNANVLVNSSFAMSPGVPVRRGDVIGFYSSELTSLLYSPSSQQDEIVYTGASQGPLCNFSFTIADVWHKVSALPLISLTYMNATNQVIQVAEQRLPLIGNSCTTVPVPGITMSMSTLMTAGTRGSDSQEATTLTIPSDSVNSGSVTDESSSDDRFLSLSLLEFILVVVILAVVVISILVVVIIACCCCLYMQQMQAANNNCETTCTVKPDELHIPMNTNPVYQEIRSQMLTQKDHPPSVVTQSQYDKAPAPYANQLQICTTLSQPQASPVCKIEQLQTCAGSQDSEVPQIALATPCNQAASLAKSGVGCIGKQISLQTPVDTQNNNSIQHQQQPRQSSIDGYSYPNLRVEWFQSHPQYECTPDGYIIIQPDQYRQDSCIASIDATNEENFGSRGVMDHTL